MCRMANQSSQTHPSIVYEVHGIWFCLLLHELNDSNNMSEALSRILCAYLKNMCNTCSNYKHNLKIFVPFEKMLVLTSRRSIVLSPKLNGCWTIMWYWNSQFSGRLFFEYQTNNHINIGHTTISSSWLLSDLRRFSRCFKMRTSFDNNASIRDAGRRRILTRK
jgi:hypothetical protein